MSENNNINIENTDIEKKKEQYFKRLKAIYKIQRIYLIATSLFVSTIIIFGAIMFYQTKSKYSIALSVIGLIYVVRNIINFRKLKKPDITAVENQINLEMSNTSSKTKDNN